MPYELDHRLVVGVASSALFDLRESQAVFDEHGLERYREHQLENLAGTLPPGVAFPFVQRLLALNDLAPDDPLVEVFVLSKNDPTTGLRVMRSVEDHGLDIKRAVFTAGEAPLAYIRPLNITLFLSGSADDVRTATAQQLPAGEVLGSSAVHTDDGEPGATLRVAFDFDGVLADDEAERVWRTQGPDAYIAYESERRAEPLQPGPLRDFLLGLGRIQAVERERNAEDPAYTPRVRVSVVTARQAPTHERAVQTLRSWGVEVNDGFFLGGVSKDRVLRTLKPHIYFDDQRTHLDPLDGVVARVLLPYGIANTPVPGAEPAEEGTP